MKLKLEEAVRLRKDGKGEEALNILMGLLPSFSNNPDLSYQIAWTYDSMGKESEAVPYYEKALVTDLLTD